MLSQKCTGCQVNQLIYSLALFVHVCVYVGKMHFSVFSHLFSYLSLFTLIKMQFPYDFIRNIELSQLKCCCWNLENACKYKFHSVYINKNRDWAEKFQSLTKTRETKDERTEKTAFDSMTKSGVRIHGTQYI